MTEPSTPRRARRGEPQQFLRDLPLDSATCIDWPFARKPDGYGMVLYEGRTHNAHRIAALLHVPNPDNKPNALHAPKICNRRICVSPSHIRWGSQAENIADKHLDGTFPKGELSANAKLTNKQAKYIYSLKGGNLTQMQIAKMFGVSRDTISGIWLGKQWSHITKAPRKET